MGIFDIFDEPDSIIDPTSSYDDMQDKIESDKEEDKKDECDGKSISSFFKRLFE